MTKLWAEMSKSKAFTEEKFNFAQMLSFDFEREDNIVEEAAGCQHFFLFPQCF